MCTKSTNKAKEKEVVLFFYATGIKSKGFCVSLIIKIYIYVHKHQCICNF